MSAADDDDGFGDFLSEDEEECALQTQEMAALARKMKTVGVRAAIDDAKERSLQEGFDAGFNAAAHDAFRFSVLRGALCVAVASGLTIALDASDSDALASCIEELRVRSLRVPRVTMTAPEALVDGAATATATVTDDNEDASDAALLERAAVWLTRLELPRP